MRNSQNHDLLQLREIFEDFAVEIPKYVSERPDPWPISDPVHVDIGRFITTSRLITDFPPLPEKSILAESQKQQREKSKKP